VALLTPTNLTTIASPQQKGLSPKKRVMVHSPHQSMTNEVASLSGSSPRGSDRDEHMASSSESESSSSLCSASSGQGARAVFSGGHCHASTGSWRGGRGQQPTLRSQYAESSDKSSSSAVGSNSSPSHSLSSEQSSGGKNLSLQSPSNSSKSSGLPSPENKILTAACKLQATASWEYSFSDEEVWGERAPLTCNPDPGSPEGTPSIGFLDEASMAGLWPGQKSTPLLSQFVALHF
jgi:hypothetical protein